MTWELYEVWSEDSRGHTELIDTTKSLVEARDIAKRSLNDTVAIVSIYRELNGELELVEELIS
jgi:hypothetical protein